MCEQTKLCHL